MKITIQELPKLLNVHQDALTIVAYKRRLFWYNINPHHKWFSELIILIQEIASAKNVSLSYVQKAALASSAVER